MIGQQIIDTARATSVTYSIVSTVSLASFLSKKLFISPLRYSSCRTNLTHLPTRPCMIPLALNHATLTGKILCLTLRIPHMQEDLKKLSQASPQQSRLMNKPEKAPGMFTMPLQLW